MRFPAGPRLRTVGAFSAITVTMATLAVLHPGIENADLDLHDGGVWVTNLNMPGGRSVAAHLNYPSRTLDSYTQPPTNDFDVSQEAHAVVLHDRRARGVASVDTATWQLGAPARLPRGAEAVQGGDVIAIADPNQGKVWAVPAGTAEAFSADAEPALTDVPGVRATAGRAGSVHAVTPDGTVHDLTRSGDTWVATEAGSVPEIADGDHVTLAAVGDTPVVVNHTAGWVGWPDGSTEVPDLAEAVLQQPGDTADALALATPSALVQVPLDGDDTVVRDVAPNGTPVAPVTVGSCTYAAWSGTGQFVRDCADDSRDEDEIYPQLARSDQRQSDLVFRTNRDVVVLNDAANGDVFLVDDEMVLVNDWTSIQAEIDQEDEKKSDDVEMRVFRRSDENRPPDARDDRFGVRPGTAVTLPVLANDTDPDGDVLLATPETADTPLGPVEQVRSGRALRIIVPDDATGSTSFTYEASDGRPSGRDRAAVRLEVRPDAANSPPVQVEGRTSELTMVQRGTAEHRILQEWMDPDGDPFWVDRVEFPDGMDGTFRPDGLIKVTDDGTEQPGRREVTVVLTDGRDATEATLRVDVKPRNPLPPVANADFVEVVVGEQVTVSPLVNDTDPNGDDLFLTHVGQVAGGRISGDLTDDTFTFTGQQVGVHYVEYSISDGPHGADGVVRVDVTRPDGSDELPVPDADLAVLPASGEILVDVLSNDTDPLGGVLVLQSVDQGSEPGLVAEVVDHEFVRVRDAGMGTGPVTVSYQVANANGSATGTITVVQDRDPQAGVPLAVDDRATVRSGDVVTVDVLANDVSPGGHPLRVLPDLAVPEGERLGTAFVSDDKVRFKADGDSGVVRVKYTVADPDDNAHTATLEIAIQPTSGSNNAPAPPPMTARLIEGGSKEIHVPLDGIDPDGDSVTLLGIEDAPEKGVATVESGVITYQSAAGESPTGTDSFTYLVEDRYGAQAVGQVSVGIAPRPARDEPPIAMPDELRVRPDRLLSVPVLVNDIDPEGEPLALIQGDVEQVEGTATEAEVADGRIELRTSGTPGVLRHTYGVVDRADNQARGDLVIDVDPDAPLQPPLAVDDIVPLADVVGQDQVTVAVLDNDEDPDGAASILTPATDVSGVEVTDDGELVIPLLPERQVVLYSVTDEDDLTGHAVVVVPGTDSLAAQRPVIRSDAPLPLRVEAGELLEIDVADLVVVRKGRTPTVPFTENVQPGPGWDGSKVLEDDQTLLYRSVEDFHGMTSMTFLVTDADGARDKDARTAVLTVPIEVTSAGRTPPSLVPPTIEVAPGEDAWTRDLRRLASDPDPGDLEKLRFSLGDLPRDLDVSLRDGSVLTVSAPRGTQVGVSRDFTITVDDGTTAPVQVAATATVVASTRPPMSVRDAVLDAEAGKPTTVDVADYVTNPYADQGEPVRLVGTPTANGPARVSASGTRVTVTPAADFSGLLPVSYVVADASGEQSRRAQGQIRLRVRGVPDAPTAVTAAATKSQTVEVNWRPGANNGSPITGYRVEWTGGGSGSRTLGNRTSLTVDGLTNNRDYVFTVVAINAVGESPRSAPSRAARPDQVPTAPTSVAASFGDRSLDVTWARPVYDGSPVRRYQVEYNGRIATTSGPERRITLRGLTNGTTYRIRVRGINDAEAESNGVAGAGAWSGVVTEHPNGVPSAPTNLSIDADGPDADPSAVISWTAPHDNGSPVEEYQVRKNGGATVGCASLGPTSCRVALTPGEDASFSVRARNRANPAKNIDGWGAWSAATAQVRGAAPPGQVRNLRAVPTGSSGQTRVTFDGADLRGAQGVTYHYQVQSGGSGTLTSGQVLGGLPDGQTRTVEVWAVTTANGKQSAPGPRAGASVSTFAPCTVSVSRVRENYDNVTFGWTVTPRGRSCAYSGSPGNNPSGTTASARSGETNVGSGPNQNVSLTVTVRTVTGGSDPAVANASASASGRTWRPWVDWGAGGTCTQLNNCRRATAHLTDWRPNSQVYCEIPGINLTTWSRTFTVNGGGDWGPGDAGWIYNSNSQNPNDHDGKQCWQR